MSNRATAKAVANNLLNVTKTPNAASKKAPTFLTFRFQANAQPINCTTFPMTKEFVLDPTHPLHIKTTRRLNAFDPSILHWTVKTPLDLSKKATVRGWAIRRVKVAFKAALQEGGWQTDGRRIAYNGQRSLSGALCIDVNKDKSVIEASGEDVKRQCGWLLRKVVQLQTRRADNGGRGGW